MNPQNNPSPALVTNSCPVCNATAARDEKLLDELQTAMLALTGVDGYDSWQLRSMRAKASLLEALRLLQAKKW